MSATSLRFTTTRAAERANGSLALCSPAGRLLWFELRLLMAENEDEPGFLLIDGKRPTPAQIATLTATDPAQVKELLAELEGHKVFVRDKRGVVYCAAMVRRAKLRENGKRGGNPNLLASKRKPGLVNLALNQGANQAEPTECSKPLPAKETAAVVNQGPNQAPRSLIGESESGNPLSQTESFPNKPARKRPGAASSVFDREFEESFWPAYPRREAKQAARAAFAKARAGGAALDVIVAGLERSNAAWLARRTDKTLIPHPASWLNGGRWDDEPAVPSPAAIARCGTRPTMPDGKPDFRSPYERWCDSLGPDSSMPRL